MSSSNTSVPPPTPTIVRRSLLRFVLLGTAPRTIGVLASETMLLSSLLVGLHFASPIEGGFRNTHPEDLLAPVLKALLDKTKLNPSEVGDIVVGTVLAPGSQRAIECRMASFYAGFPENVPLRTVNRQCSSGLQAVADIAAAIKSGFYEIGIAAGLESMTVDKIRRVSQPNTRAEMFAQARDCLLPVIAGNGSEGDPEDREGRKRRIRPPGPATCTVNPGRRCRRRASDGQVSREERETWRESGEKRGSRS